MRTVVNYAKALARELLSADLNVRIGNDNQVPALAAYRRRGCRAGDLMFNVALLGADWFENGITSEIDALLIHEFGHHFESDHLSSEYHDALCELGAKLKQLALAKPEFFDEFSAAASMQSEHELVTA
jgi:hypothetical protein